MLSDRRTVKNNNNNNFNANLNINNNNIILNTKNCDNSASTVYDDLKNKIQMDALNNGDLSNNNINISNNNNSSSSSTSNSGIALKKANAIKKERLSPGANGDGQSSMSRSRSATPSSYPETPPQQLQLNDIVGQNLSANLLSTLSARPNEFQARNYSDFMRTLAAKYNNIEQNDPPPRKSPLIRSRRKESPSPPDTRKQSSNPATSQLTSNSPFVSSLFCNLQIPSVVFPPLIDMSSTQALVTLARAAKEAEIQNILKNATQKRSFPGAPSTSPKASEISQVASQIAQAVLENKTLSNQPSTLPTGFPAIPPFIPSQSLASERQSPATPSIVPTNASPLDLSSSQQPKRQKTQSEPVPSCSSNSGSRVQTPTSTLVQPKEETGKLKSWPETTTTPGICQAHNDEVSSWTVEDVYEFVSSIELCAEYAQNFREQQIDGSGLPLLTEEHLTSSLGMKLGPALKLRSILAKKLGGPCPCVACTTNQRLNLQAASSSCPSSFANSHQAHSSGSSLEND